MPEHIVVRCYSCQSFQAQQLRKTNDFVCKMCGSKQSVRKIYARSFKAADIRPIVQEYNMKRGELEEEDAQATVQRVAQRATLREGELREEEQRSVRVNEWQQYVEEERDTTSDTCQRETGAELLTALPEYKRPSKSGNSSVPAADKWSAQPKRSMVTGVKRKWTASEARDSDESAPKYARHEHTARHVSNVSNASPRLISTAHLARTQPNGPTPPLTRVTSESVPSQHVIDKIRAMTQNTRVTASVGHVSNPVLQPVTRVTPTPAPNNNQKKKSEWDDFIDEDEPADDTCQDGGDLLLTGDTGAHTDEW